MKLDNLEAYIKKIFKKYGNRRFSFGIKLSFVDFNTTSVTELIELCNRYLLNLNYNSKEKDYIYFNYMAMEKHHWYLEELKNERVD